jgi:hypothetical protein
VKRISRIAAVLACLAYPALVAGQASASHTADVTATITVLDRRPNDASLSRITKDDVVVRQNGEVRPVLDWQPLSGSSTGIDLAVLIDDSLASRAALQWQDVAGFIRLLPKDSRVAVAYASHSGASVAQPFITDRELAIKALRMPLGGINEGASIYLSLVDLIDHWPSDGHRRMVMLISDGVDLSYGVLQSQPGLNQDLQQAIDKSQKDGVVVDALFASGASHFSHNLFLVNNGQGCLARLALETGGSAYTPGLDTPISFAPFLRQVAESMANMYLVTFRAALPPKPGFARLQFDAEPAGVELLGPSRVYLPPAP